MAKPQANFHSRTGFQVKTFGKVPHDRDNHWQKLFAIYIEHIQTSRCLKIIKYFSASFRTFQNFSAPSGSTVCAKATSTSACAAAMAPCARWPVRCRPRSWRGGASPKESQGGEVKWLNRYEMVWYCADTVPYSTMLLSIYENKWL